MVSDYLIEGSRHSQVNPESSSWSLYGRTDNLFEARKIAAKAFEKTNYLIIRVRQKS
jgi:hypothetical protein